MRYSPAVESVPVLRPLALLLALLVVVAVLWLSYQSEDVFMPHPGEVDAVSASYAELLLNADPDNVELRVDLLDQLIQLGKFSRAQEHLHGWRGDESDLKAFYELVVDANIAIVNQSQTELAAARQRIADFPYHGLSPARQTQLLGLALALGLPGTAADIQTNLADIQPSERSQLLASAAQHYVAAGQQKEAAQQFAILANEADSPEQAAVWMWSVVDAFVAAEAPDEAAVYLLEQLDAQRAVAFSDAQWERAIALAQGAQRLDLAEQLAVHWERQQQENKAAMRAQFNLQLAAGNTAAAWETGQRLLAADPLDAEHLRQMAQLAQWLNQPERALDYWLAYLDQVPDVAVLDSTWRLALQLFDYERGIDLLSAAAATRRLTDEELDALIYAHEQRGTPAQAEQWLRGYVRQAGGQRLAWSRLLQNLQNTLQPEAEADMWEVYAAQYALTPAERVSWAEVLWNLYQPERAWEVLADAPGDKQPKEYWRMRAALAWELGREEEVRHSYERMLSQSMRLNNSEERQLIEIYRRQNPQQALAMLVDSWHRTGDGRYLTDALLLAEDLQNWPVFKELLAQASEHPHLAAQLAVRVAKARLAEDEGRIADAETLYLEALSADPNSTMLRQRLLWLYIGNGPRQQLAARLKQWEPQALDDGSMWLVMAAANQSLGHNERALEWYQRYLTSNPDDLLALAASADSLEASGRHAAALQLRTRLLPRLVESFDQPASLNDRALWARLMLAAGGRQQSMASIRQWQDGSVGLLQLWYTGQLERLDETNQEAQKDAWLAWGRARGLTEEYYQRVQEALRRHQPGALAAAQEMGELDAASRVAVLEQSGKDNAALSEALSYLGDEQPQAVRQQLWLQAVALTERYPQGLRAAWQREDFGGLKLDGPQLTMARFINDNTYAQLHSSRLKYQAKSLDTGRLGAEENLDLTYQRQLANGDWSLALDRSERADDDRTGLAVSRRWQRGRDEFELGLNWQRENRDTGLMRALGQEDSIWLTGRHSITARDQLSWMVAQRRFDTRSGADLGSGQQASIDFSQVQFFSGPTWVLRTGLDMQRNKLTNSSLDSLLVANGGVVRQSALNADQLLPERVGRVYVGSHLSRGTPGALNRTRGQYTWLLDTSLGWDWEDQSSNFSVTGGVGIEVLGDDELAFTAGYQSAPIGGAGKAGGTATLSYSSRFGR